jgi:hypothetical protein
VRYRDLGYALGDHWMVETIPDGIIRRVVDVLQNAAPGPWNGSSP